MHDSASASVQSTGQVPVCEFCGLPCPPEPVTVTANGEQWTFCSGICRDAVIECGFEPEAAVGFERFDPAVPVLSTLLPEGLPRNSFTLISSEPGASGDALLIELVWYALQSGGSAAIVAYQEPPVSVLEQFLALGWNVLPHLEADRLHVIDCFTYRVEESERMVDRFDRWNAHLRQAAESATRLVRNPAELPSVANKLDDCIETEGLRDGGIVVVDSLTEIGSLAQPMPAYNFVKDLRADITKGRFVPVFAHATRRKEEETEEFPHDLAYMMDGIVELRVSDDLPKERFTKHIGVRKMRGVPTAPAWMAYEYVSGRGLVPVRKRPPVESPRPPPQDGVSPESR